MSKQSKVGDYHLSHDEMRAGLAIEIKIAKLQGMIQAMQSQVTELHQMQESLKRQVAMGNGLTDQHRWVDWFTGFVLVEEGEGDGRPHNS